MLSRPRGTGWYCNGNAVNGSIYLVLWPVMTMMVKKMMMMSMKRRMRTKTK